VPLALVVAFFVSRYSDDIFGTSDTGLDATARARFDSTAQACLRAQNSDPASKAFSPVVIDQYCHCYANGMADRLSDDDLRLWRPWRGQPEPARCNRWSKPPRRPV